MKTLSILIGNSDDKLRQVEWSDFISALDEVVKKYAVEIQFSGGSDPRACWQNFCWVFTTGIGHEDGAAMQYRLKRLCEKFRQESIAVVIGETKMINGGA